MVSHREQRLDNGLDLVAVEQPHLHSAEVSLSVRVGSRHETEKEWGLSHLVEHMLFRGSARFPDTRRLARAFERSGGTLYAATWRDHTNLSLSVHPSKLEWALETLADMVRNPRFEGLDVERAIVEDELQGELDEHGADTDICNLSRASIWRGHPMGRRIAGSYESVASFDIGDVVAHHARHYVGANTILTVAGRIDADRVAELAERALGELPAGERTSNGEAATFSPSTEIDAHSADGAHLQVQLTWEALPAGHPDFLTQTVITRLLDDGVGSRLQEAVCDRRGLVYRLTTGLDCYADCGLYDIELQVSPRRAATAVAATLETVHDLLTDGVGEEELSILRERMLHEIEFSVDSTDDLAEHYGVGALLGDVQSLDEQARQLREVTGDEIVRIARQMFLTRRVHATLLGPIERANMKRISALLEGFPALKPSAMTAGSARRRAVV